MEKINKCSAKRTEGIIHDLNQLRSPHPYWLARYTTTLACALKTEERNAGNSYGDLLHRLPLEARKDVKALEKT